MSEKKMTVKTTFDIADYTAMVDLIVSGYFNNDGEYEPHWGRINTMMLFYEHCVTDAGIVDKDVTDLSVDDMNLILSNESFIEAYDNAHWGHEETSFMPSGLSFRHAVSDAMEIVELKKSSADRVITMLEKAVINIGKQFSTALSEDTLKDISEIANAASKNGNFAEALVREYVKSGRINEIMQNSKKTSSKTSNGTKKKTATTKKTTSRQTVAPVKK